MDESSEAGPSARQLEGQETDVLWLQLIKTSQEVQLGDRVPLQDLPQECSLLALSNIRGLVIVGGAEDVRIYRLSELQAGLESTNKASYTPIQVITLPSRPVWVRLAMEDERLVIYTHSALHTYRLTDVLRGDTTPYHTFEAMAQPLDILPNPAPNSEPQARYVAVVAGDGMVMADVEGRVLLDPVDGPFTAGCWSAKGKQIVLGTSEGKLLRYTPEGALKGDIPPPELEQPGYPSFVHWLDTQVFLAGYAPTDGSPSDPLDIFIIHRQPSEIIYTKFYDPLDTMGVPGRSGLYRYYSGLKQWGDSKHLGLMMSGLASEVAVLRGKADGEWEACMLDETARAIMPIGKGGAEDAACIGFALDLTSTQPVKRGMIGGVEMPDLPPPPRVLVYSQNGTVIAFDVRNLESGAYPGMVVPKVTPESMEAKATEDSAVPNQEPTGLSGGSSERPPASAASAFGQALTFGQSSGSLSTPKSTGGFAGFGKPSGSGGFAGFGQASTTPDSTPVKTTSAFKQSSFDQPSTSAFGSSAFGQSAFGQSPTPSFGQSSFGQSPSAFGTTSSPSSIGFGAFGNAKPAASSTGFGQAKSAFGTSYQDPTKSGSGFGGGSGGAFGANSAFGQSSFGSSTFGQPSASGFAGFGNGAKVAEVVTPSDEFGLGGFASALDSSGKAAVVPGLPDSPPSSPVLRSQAPGLEDSPPGSPTLSQTQSGSGFAKPATTGGTGFGAHSTPSSSTPSFIKPATAFGGSASGFGAFGQTAKTSPFETKPASASSPFTPSTPTPVSGATAFGQTSTPSKPAFGGSAFGQSSKPTAFGQSSVPSGGFSNISGGFGGFAAKSTTSTQNGSASSGSGGFGGFATSAKSTTGFGAPASGGGFAALLSGDKTPDIFGKKQDTVVQPSAPVRAEQKGIAQPDLQASASASSSGPDSSQDDQEVGDKVQQEPAVLPDGYGIPPPRTEVEPAVPPAGYDVSGADTEEAEATETPAVALQTALPEPTIAAEETPAEAAVPLPSPDGEEAAGDSGLLGQSSAYEVVEPGNDDDEYDEYEEDDDEDDLSYEEEEHGEEGESNEEDADEEGEDEEEANSPDSQSAESDTESSAMPADTPSPRPTLSTNEPGPSAPSLLSRLSSGPSPRAAPADQPSLAPKFPFNNKHASRTASPLGSQPPHTPEASTTPPVSPFKSDAEPAASGSSLFAPKEDRTAAETASSQAGAKPLFDFGLGKPPAPADNAAPKPSPFGQSLFGVQVPATTPPASAKSSFGFGGLGLGQPPASPATVQKPAFDFGLPKTEQKTIPVPPMGNVKNLASVFESPPKSEKAPAFSFDQGKVSTAPIAAKTAPIFGSPPDVKPSISTITPPAANVMLPPATSFATPSRQPVPSRAERKSSGSATMASVMEGLVQDLQADLLHLEQCLAAAEKQHAALRSTNFVKVTEADLDKHSALPLSSVKDTSDIADSLLRQLRTYRNQDGPVEPKLAELQSLMLKIDMKSGTLEQFAKAQDDPSVVKTIQVTQLSAQQSADQARLTQAVQDVEIAVEDLEMGLAGLRRRLEAGNDPAGSPSERLERSIRDLDSKIQSHQQSLDNLSGRFNAIDLSSSPSRSPHPTPKYISLTSTPQSPSRPAVFRVPADVQADVQAALKHNPIRDLAQRLRGTRMTKSDSRSTLIFSRSRGSVDMRTIPAPGTVPSAEDADAPEEQEPSPPEIKEEPVSLPSTPTPSAFSGIKFSLDPGQITSQHRSGGSGRASNSNRQHAPAARLGTGSSAVSAAGTMPGGFDFALPSPSTEKGGAGNKVEPSGFFSFSGYGPK